MDKGEAKECGIPGHDAALRDGSKLLHWFIEDKIYDTVESG